MNIFLRFLKNFLIMSANTMPISIYFVFSYGNEYVFPITLLGLSVVSAFLLWISLNKLTSDNQIRYVEAYKDNTRINKILFMYFGCVMLNELSSLSVDSIFTIVGLVLIMPFIFDKKLLLNNPITFIFSYSYYLSETESGSCHGVLSKNKIDLNGLTKVSSQMKGTRITI